MTQNIQIVQKCYAEFAKGNAEGVLDLLHENVKWIDPGYPDIPYAGRRNGKEEVLNFFMDMGSQVEFTAFEPQQFFSDHEFVIVKGYFTAKSRKTGKTGETEWVMIWQVTDEKVQYYQAYIDTLKIASIFK